MQREILAKGESAMTVERNKKIYDRRASGEIYRTIGEDYGISVERVRQVYCREVRRRKKEELRQRQIENGWIKERAE